MENVKFCPHCGTQVDAQAVVCIGCGRKLEPAARADDCNSKGLNALAFFFPFVGLIMYLCMMNSTPVKAKGIGKWALIGFIVGVVFAVLCTVLTSCIAMMGIMDAAYYYF